MTTSLRAPPERPSRELAEQIAHTLLSGSDGVEVAFLRAHQGIYFARRSSHDWPPTSAVVRLLRGLYELEPRRAVWIARNRIFSTAAPRAACRGAVRVAARRLEGGIAPRDHGARVDVPFIDCGAAAPRARRTTLALDGRLDALVSSTPAPGDDRSFMRLAIRLAEEVRDAGLGDPESDRKDHPIAAILASAGGELLGWATATGSRNATLHAEANLVAGFLERTGALLPSGARIYSTLKPCKMCAGLIWDCTADRASLRVRYAEDDPKRFARETVLDRGSMDRRFASAAESELALEIQEQLAIRP